MKRHTKRLIAGQAYAGQEIRECRCRRRAGAFIWTRHSSGLTQREEDCPHYQNFGEARKAAAEFARQANQAAT
jgi:hypothetical protein